MAFIEADNSVHQSRGWFGVHIYVILRATVTSKRTLASGALPIYLKLQ